MSQEWRDDFGIGTGRGIDMYRRLETEAPDLYRDFMANKISLSAATKELQERVMRSRLRSGGEVLSEDTWNSDKWGLGAHKLICGDMSSLKSEIGRRYKLVIATADDLLCDNAPFRLNHIQEYSGWLRDHADYVAVTCKPDVLPELLRDVRLPYLWTFSSILQSEGEDVHSSMRNTWFPTVIYDNTGDGWDRLPRDKNVDVKSFKGDKLDDQEGVVGYSNGSRPQAYYRWLMEMHTDPGDSVLIIHDQDGQSVFGAAAGRKLTIVEPTRENCERIVARWYLKYEGGVTRLE